MKILEVLVQDRKTNNTKIGVVEARLNYLEAGINTIASAITNIKNQMDQVQQKIEEDKVKAAAQMVDINKKWVSKQKKDEASTSRMNFGDCPTPSGPLHTPQRAAVQEAEAPAKQELVRHNRIVLPCQPKRKFKLEKQFKHILNIFCKVHTNIPLVDSLQEIPMYAKLLREAVMKKKRSPKPISSYLFIAMRSSKRKGP